MAMIRVAMANAAKAIVEMAEGSGSGAAAVLIILEGARGREQTRLWEIQTVGSFGSSFEDSAKARIEEIVSGASDDLLFEPSNVAGCGGIYGGLKGFIAFAGDTIKIKGGALNLASHGSLRLANEMDVIFDYINSENRAHAARLSEVTGLPIGGLSDWGAICMYQHKRRRFFLFN